MSDFRYVDGDERVHPCAGCGMLVKEKSAPTDHANGCTGWVDWSGSDKYAEHTCECDCGARWQTHVKALNVDGTLRIVARKPCPTCGNTMGLRTARGSEYVKSVMSLEMVLGVGVASATLTVYPRPLCFAIATTSSHEGFASGAAMRNQDLNA